MVRAQAMLIDHFGIDTLFCVAGGSMGGMQVLQWAASYPERVFAAMPIATAARHSSQNIAFHEVGRQAIMADPEWRGGRYLDEGVRPEKGLAVARMSAHITYLSEQALQRKFGRKLQDRSAPTFSFDADFQIESYLRHQGLAFVERFDANSYLFVTRACDYFDLAADLIGKRSPRPSKGAKTRFCVISFTSDWLYPTSASRAIVHALNAAAAPPFLLSRLRATKGMTPFCFTSPIFLPPRAAFWMRRRRRAASLRWRLLDDAAENFRGVSILRSRRYCGAWQSRSGRRLWRRLVARKCSRARKMSTVGASNCRSAASMTVLPKGCP